MNLEGSLPGLYQGNSVHLSDVGFDNRNLNIQSCVKLATDWVVGNLGLLDVWLFFIWIGLGFSGWAKHTCLLIIGYVSLNLNHSMWYFISLTPIKSLNYSH